MNIAKNQKFKAATYLLFSVSMWLSLISYVTAIVVPAFTMLVSSVLYIYNPFPSFPYPLPPPLDTSLLTGAVRLAVAS